MVKLKRRGHPPFRPADKAQAIFRAAALALVANKVALKNLGPSVSFSPSPVMDVAARLLIDSGCMNAGSPDMPRAAGVGYRAVSDPKGVCIFLRN